MFHSQRRFSLPILLLLASAGLAGCHETLVYGEETGFNLAIQVNDDPKTPVQVNTGLKRTVGQMTPPVQVDQENENGGTKATGDAVSTFSGFRLEYLKNGWFLGDLTIKTQFATGWPAAELSTEPTIAAAFLNTDYIRSEDHVSDENIARVEAIIRAIDDSSKLSDEAAKILACNPPLTNVEMRNNVDMDPTCMRVADADAARRYLKFQASMGDRTEEQLKIWEEKLGITP